MEKCAVVFLGDWKCVWGRDINFVGQRAVVGGQGVLVNCWTFGHVLHDGFGRVDGFWGDFVFGWRQGRLLNVPNLVFADAPFEWVTKFVLWVGPVGGARKK
ncbi:MAG: hypothetical protein N3A53_03405 [Verrucomicrobiae bacterium]|nr:hypothetical protein [Verrucomicrobiae bacterium]